LEPDGNYSALVCLSGGVDSTAALLRSKIKFHRVRAVYVQTERRTPPEQAFKSCRKLGIKLITADAGELFNREIKQFTAKTYRSGCTPNPCALCNSKVKLALPFSMLENNELLVTGHYACNSFHTLSRGKDSLKDQSYFLSLVPKEILKRCYFPLGESTKGKVRAEVVENGLSFVTRESQDLCFKREGFGIPGDIVNVYGAVVGRHSGLGGYTPGQRKGLGAHNGRKFVVELDTLGNRLIIGDEDDLYSETCILNSINWLEKPAEKRFECGIQTRYRKAAVSAEVIVHANGNTATVIFSEPQKAVAPGQVGAMFLSNSVIGGGIIAGHGGDTDA
jgi:tRNA-specific 2-thiouridylase